MKEFYKKYYITRREKCREYNKKWREKKKQEKLLQQQLEEELPNIQDVEELLKNEPIIQVEQIANQEKEENIKEIYESEYFILAENYKTDLQIVNQEKEELFKKYNSVLKDNKILAENNRILIDTVSKLRKRIEELTFSKKEKEIKPIKTFYKGIEFRSRLEARWARFFDACGVKWEYEPEGYELGNGLRYLPDFKLYNIVIFDSDKYEKYFSVYVEVKGNMTENDSKKINSFCRKEKTEIFIKQIGSCVCDKKDNIYVCKNPIILVGNIPQDFEEMCLDNWHSEYKPAFYDLGYILPDFNIAGEAIACFAYKNRKLAIIPYLYNLFNDNKDENEFIRRETEKRLAIARNEKFEDRKIT